MALNDKTPQNTSEALFAPGEIVGGRYKVLSILGRGGMGLVYRVEQIIDGEQLALKTIHKNFLNETTIKRFENEARATFAVNHANIIAVKAFGLLDDSTPFLAMEIVNGETIAELLNDSGPLPIEVALPIIIQVCFGLAHAHQNAVVHRDIKPSNIMILKDIAIGTEGSIKILDFGIAKFSHREGGEIQALTKTGEIFGSPIYMSPEQCVGSKVDKRSDIYSLGCVIFETLTGQPPFKGTTALATLMMHQMEPPPRLAERSEKANFPEDLERIVAQMLAKDPADRYQDLGVVAHDLSSIVNRSDSNKISRPLSLSKAGELGETATIKSKQGGLSIVAASTLLLIMLALAGASVYFFASLTSDKTATNLKIETVQQQKTSTASPEAKETIASQSVITAKQPTETKGTIDGIHIGNIEPNAALIVNKMTIEELKQEIALNKDYLNLQSKLITAEMLEIIGKTKNINHINFDGSNIDNNALDQLSKLMLTNITLNNSTFNDLGAQKLAAVSNLRSIKASETALSSHGLRYLKKLKKLTHLKIVNTQVDTAGVRDFCQDSSLRELSLADCSKILLPEQQKLQKEFPKILFKDVGKGIL